MIGHQIQTLTKEKKIMTTIVNIVALPMQLTITKTESGMAPTTSMASMASITSSTPTSKASRIKSTKTKYSKIPKKTRVSSSKVSKTKSAKATKPKKTKAVKSSAKFKIKSKTSAPVSTTSQLVTSQPSPTGKSKVKGNKNMLMPLRASKSTTSMPTTLSTVRATQKMPPTAPTASATDSDSTKKLPISFPIPGVVTTNPFGRNHSGNDTAAIRSSVTLLPTIASSTPMPQETVIWNIRVADTFNTTLSSPSNRSITPNHIVPSWSRTRLRRHVSPLRPVVLP